MLLLNFKQYNLLDLYIYIDLEVNNNKSKTSLLRNYDYSLKYDLRKQTMLLLLKLVKKQRNSKKYLFRFN